MRLRRIFDGSTPYLRIFDWTLGVGAVAWGIYAQNWVWIVGGVLGLAVAWYDPGTRLRRKLAFVKPRQDAKARR